MTADLFTFGTWRLGRAFKKKCGVCGHLMKDHQTTPTVVEYAAAAAPPPQPQVVVTTVPEASAASPQPPQEDQLQRLERLAALHRDGALTDEEFAAEKAKLLAQ
jgi:hypothetical protein